MRSKRRLLSLGVASMVIASGLVAAFGTTAAHATTLPWAHDPNDVGTISFFDATGNRVLGGNVSDSPFAAFAEASHAGRAANPGGGVVADTKATLFGALPKSGADPGAWTSEQLSGSTTFPDAAAPAPLSTATLPVVDLTGASLADLIADLPNVAVDAYAGLYELRIKTSGPGQTADATYDAADIQVTGTGPTATWQQLNVQTATTVTFTASPASGVYHGTGVTLTAHATVGVPGIVTFYDGTKVVYSHAASTAGVAAVETAGYAGGTHHFHVTFVPTNSALYGSSTSASDTYVIKARPTALQIRTSASSIVYKHYVTLTSTVTPVAAGTLRIYRSGKLWYTHAISGTFAVKTSSLAVGTYTFKSIFTPSVATSFVASASNTIVVKVIK